MLGLLRKFKNALAKTSASLGGRVRALFGSPWNETTFEELERILFEADLGSQAAIECTDYLRKELRLHPVQKVEEILRLLENYALQILSRTPLAKKTTPSAGEPLVLLIVGVNGSGKTTSLIKLAHHFQSQGKKVLLAAGDTFRAAAIEQLSSWAERLGLDIIKGKPGGDPSAVVFDALTAAQHRKVDIILIDTAGRLQNRTDLMHELQKIRATCTKIIPGAPHETLLVLDATTGQNALDQAKTFHEFTPLSGIILSKLDGSAKGGIILPLYQQLGIPICWVGTGEGPGDLEPFDPTTYAHSLFGLL